MNSTADQNNYNQLINNEAIYMDYEVVGQQKSGL